MTRLKIQRKTSKSTYKDYQRFKQVNGKHPLQKETIDSHVPYRVRKRHGGKVVAFNFELAKEIGLIQEGHEEELNAELEKQILETFALVIINEFDVINKIEFPKEDIKKHPYMATRYLQLQHPNKQGKTSGDGRSIWNGSITNKGRRYDISSCGTGATCLSPATHIQGKFFQTGDPSISYGCGYSEVDEGLTTMFFSEVLHKNRLKTERVLAVIGFEKNFSITVRVHDNLIRPSHMFNHLKQGNYEPLEAMVNYYINRQESNKEWLDLPKTAKKRFDYFLKKQCEVFAQTAARFEDDYIFCWMDWDGDNILMDGGIIDYGSVRQFGLFHSEYKFDDDDRFSTNIKQQKAKAKYTVQTFAQLVNYLKRGEKSPLKSFSNDPILKYFDEVFELEKIKNLVYKIGFNSEDAAYLFKNHRESIKSFQKEYLYFERAKSELGPFEVPDGIHWNAIYCMRDILREYPQILLSTGHELDSDEFLEIIASNYATKEDLALTGYKNRKIRNFQKTYIDLVQRVAKHRHVSKDKVLLELTMRSSIINKYERVTGDSISTIVHRLMKKKRPFDPNELYSILKNFSRFQNLNPDSKKPLEKDKVSHSKFMRGILQIVRDYREGL